jgi:membrane associated rhomboid family serine protease/Flp pilus assembly protein TadD
MRRPPPIREALRFPITSAIGACAIGVSLWWWTGHSVDWAVIDGRSFVTEPWRVVTSNLPHVNPLHLVFNLYWFWVFGTLLERDLGRAKYVGIVALLAVVPAAAESVFATGGVGLSGIVYGYFGLLWTLEQRDSRFEGAVDQATVSAFVLWFFVCIGLTLTGALAVGNVAHGTGAVLGWLLGRAIAPAEGTRFERGGPPKGVWWGAIALLGIGALVGATVGQRLIHPFTYADELAAQGYAELVSGRNNEAALLLADAARLKPADHQIWHNLGVARQRMGRYSRALDAFRSEWGLLSDKPRDLTAVLVWLCVHEGDDAANGERWEDAAASYREALGYEASDAALWGRLGVASAQAGDTNGAKRALETALRLNPQDELAKKALETLQQPVQEKK